jgi:hypothetical protein
MNKEQPHDWVSRIPIAVRRQGFNVPVAISQALVLLTFAQSCFKRLFH